MFKNTTEQERKLFLEWINSKWEKELKNRRLKIIPCVENFVESACFVRINIFTGFSELNLTDCKRCDLVFRQLHEDALQ